MYERKQIYFWGNTDQINPVFFASFFFIMIILMVNILIINYVYLYQLLRINYTYNTNHSNIIYT